MKNVLKRIAVLVLVVVMVGGLIGCGGAKTEEPAKEDTKQKEQKSETSKEEPKKEEAKKEKIKIALNHATSLESPWQKASEAFADYVNTHSENVEVEVFGNGVLFQRNWEVMLEMVQTGSTQAGIESVTALGSVVPELSSIQLPFLFDSMDHVNNFFDNAEIWQEWLDLFQEKDMVPVSVSPRLFRQLINNKVLVKTPEDMKGLKFRVPSNQMFVSIFESLGAKPVPMPYGEVYTGIQLGTVVGEDNSLPVVYDYKTYEVAKKMTIWNYISDASIVFLNKDVWDSLSEEDQKIVLEAGKIWNQTNQKEDAEYTVYAREEMEKAGVEFYDMPADKKEPFKKLVAPMYDELKEKLGEEQYNKFIKAVEDTRK